MSAYFGAIIFFLVLQWAAGLGRIWARLFIVRKFGYDDVAFLITLLTSTAFFSCVIYVYKKAGNNSAYVLPQHTLYATIHVVLAGLVTYIAASTCLKVALGLLLLRIFVKRWMIYTIYAVMFVSVSYGLSYFFVVLFQCGNPLQYPERIIIDRQCLSHRTINGTSYTHAVITALADWIYAILPMIYLHNSKLIFRTKLSVGFILCIGSIGSVLTVIRIGWIHNLTAVTATFLITAHGIIILSAAELSIGITCISLACYKPIFARYLPRQRLFSTNPRSGDDSQPDIQQRGRADQVGGSRIYTPHAMRHTSTNDNPKHQTRFTFLESAADTTDNTSTDHASERTSTAKTSDDCV